MDPKSRTDFSVNDRTDMFELSESLGTQISYLTNEPKGGNRFSSFENSEPYQGDKVPSKRVITLLHSSKKRKRRQSRTSRSASR